MNYDSSNLAFGLSCAFDVALVCGAAFWLGRRPSAARFVLAAGVVGTVLAFKGLVLVADGIRVPFGIAHVLWLDLVVVAPLAGIAYLVASRRRAPRWTQTLAAATLLLAPVGAYASFVEPERLTTERATVGLAPERAGRAPLRIGVMSDLQFARVTDHEREAVARLMAERPGLILIAGDFHQGTRSQFEQELPKVRALLRPLRAPGGVYAVQGDVESVRELRTVGAGTSIRSLVNEQARVRLRDRAITIGGIQLDYDSVDAHATAVELEQAPGRSDVRILLAHRPDAVYELEPSTRVDLTVAGHTHGGQIQLPLVGPPWTASNVPSDVGAGGLHTLDGRRIYVTRGVGVERHQAPRLRFGAVPEVSIVTLR